MEGLTLTRRAARPRVRSLDADTVARVAFALLCLGFAIGFFVYPTYPNYDSYYSLLWGRELLGFDQLSFEAYRAPTEHPLAIAFGALLVPLVWAAVDFAVTGNPLYSLTATGELADELGRNKGLSAVPEALYAFLIK